MTKFKVGDKVRIISLDASLAGFEIGDEAVVKASKLDGTKTGGFATFTVSNGQARGHCDAIHIELINAKPTKNQRITALEAQVSELMAEVETLKQAKGTGKNAAKLAELVAGETVKPSKKASLTPNELRKALIAEARAFVAEQFQHGDEKKFVGGPSGHDTVEFVVNTEKRTVVAILRLAYFKGEIDTKAIAKCAPGDVFNADIGKAIALGRALGLDVSKFEQAVQPTEVVVGQVVNNTFEHAELFGWGVGKVTRIDGEGYRVTDDSWSFRDTAVIIDDTEAQYE